MLGEGVVIILFIVVVGGGSRQEVLAGRPFALRPSRSDNRLYETAAQSKAMTSPLAHGLLAVLACLSTLAGLLLSRSLGERGYATATVLATTVAGCALNVLSWGSVAQALILAGAAAWAVTEMNTGFIRNRLTFPLLGSVICCELLGNGIASAAIAVLVSATTFIALISIGVLSRRFAVVGGGATMASCCITAALGYTLGTLVIALGLIVGLLAVGFAPEYETGDAVFPTGRYLAFFAFIIIALSHLPACALTIGSWLM